MVDRIRKVEIRSVVTGHESSRRAMRGLATDGRELDKVTAGVGGSFDKAGVSATGMGKAVDGGSTSIVSMGRAALATVAAVAVFTAGVGALATNASRVNVALGAAVAETSTLIEGTREQIQLLTESSAELAATYGGTAAAQAQGYYAVISAGADFATEATDALVASNQLAIGGVADLGASIQLLTGTQNAFARQNLESIEVSNIFFEVVRNGITTIPLLAASFANVSSIAAGFGLTLETTGSAIAALTASGTRTSVAVTNIRSLINAFQNLNEEQIAFARTLGVTSTAPAEFVNSVRELQAGLSAYSTQTERADALSTIFGSNVEALSAIIALTDGGFETFNRTLDATENSAGATSRAVAKIADSDAQRLAMASGQIERANVRIGESINDIIIPAYVAWADILDRVVANGEYIERLGFLDFLRRGNPDGRTLEIDGQPSVAIQELSEQLGILAANTQDLQDANERLQTAQDAAYGAATLADQEALLVAQNNAVSVLEQRAQLEANVLIARVNAGLITQQQFRSEIQFNVLLEDAIKQRDRTETDVQNRRLMRETERLRGLGGVASADANTFAATIGGLNDPRDPNVILIEAFRERLDTQERELLASLMVNRVFRANADAEELVQLELQGERILAELRNNTASREAIEETSLEYIANLYEMQADKIIEAKKIQTQREIDEDRRATELAVREAERRRTLILTIENNSGDFASGNREASLFENDFENRREEFDADSDLLESVNYFGQRINAVSSSLERLAGVSDQSAESVATALSAIGDIASQFGIIGGIIGEGLNIIGGVITALDAIVGSENDTGFRTTAGAGGVSSVGIDTENTGLRRLFFGRRGDREATREERIEAESALRPAREIIEEIGNIFDTTFADVESFGETAEANAQNFLDITAMQVGGIDALRESGESLGDTLIRVATNAENLSNAFLDVGLNLDPNSVLGQLATLNGGLDIDAVRGLRTDEENDANDAQNFTRVLQGVVDGVGRRILTDDDIERFRTDGGALDDEITRATADLDDATRDIENVLASNNPAATASEIAMDRQTLLTASPEYIELQRLLEAARLFDGNDDDDAPESESRLERLANRRIDASLFANQSQADLAQSLANSRDDARTQRIVDAVRIVGLEIRRGNDNNRDADDYRTIRDGINMPQFA